MSQSLKKNFVYRSILTLSTYLIGLVTFPYVSRLLGVERIGLVNFVDNTINYFLLFATLGVNILGVREVAAAGNSVEARGRVFANILGMNLFFTLLTLAIYFVAVSAVPKLHQYAELFYVGAAKIVFSVFLVEWFFSGIEDFKYITLRSVAIKMLYVGAVFLLVRAQDDYALYFVLTVGVVVVNAVVNSIYIRRFVRFRLTDFFSRIYLKSNMALGFYAIMTSMYITFNVMFLGLVSSDTEVGYYTTAFKLYTIVLGIFSAFTTVMLPRMSALAASDDRECFGALVEKSFSALFTYCLPLAVCSIVLAPQIVFAFSGAGYEGAILPMRMIMGLVVVVGTAQILAVQVLMPMKRDRILLAASIAGALLSVVANVTLVSRLASVGTALVLIFSECAVTSVYLFYVRRNRILRFPTAEFFRNMLYAAPCGVICWLCGRYVEDPFAALGASAALAGVFWLVLHTALKTDAVMIFLKPLIARIK